MTKEQTREAAAVMVGWADGKEVQYRSLFSDVWEDVGEDSNQAWNWTAFLYRLKPAVTLRPWTSDEVPLGAWMRNKTNDRWIIVHIQYSSANRAKWLDEYEHSTDGGLTWKPCGVEEDKP